jgi:hypothetical protein
VCRFGFQGLATLGITIFQHKLLSPSLDDSEVERWTGSIYTVGLTGGVRVGCTVRRCRMKGVMWLRIRVGGKEMKLHCTQFVTIFVVRGVGVFDCSDGFHDDVGW